MIDEKNYYCGAYWCPMWVKKILSRSFNESCYMHDMGYRTKCLTRKEVDIRFLKQMLESSGSCYLAIVYFLFVRALGGFSWRHKDA